jgi:hypothetical protein
VFWRVLGLCQETLTEKENLRQETFTRTL